MLNREEIYRRREQRKRKKILRKIIVVLIILVLLALAAVLIAWNNTLSGDSSAGTSSAVQTVKSVDEKEEQQTQESETKLITAPTAEPTIQPTPTSTPVPISRRGTAVPIPESVRSMMSGKSMKSNSNIGYDDLSYLTIPHYDFAYNVTEGHLVVNAALAEEVLDIFAELYDARYPIERMELVDKYGADDYESIEYNNTSAFNYRESTDGTGKLSKHALGRAIDINPQINPYVNSSGRGSHSNAAEYWSRDISKWTSQIAKAAYIGPGTEIYRIFVTEHGWTWGGSWSTYRDYQHFQK